MSNGATPAVYGTVDTYTLGQQFLNSGDSTPALLWTSTIARTGRDAAGATISAHTIKLTANTPTPNRVDAIGDDAPALNRARLGLIGERPRWLHRNSVHPRRLHPYKQASDCGRQREFSDAVPGFLHPPWCKQPLNQLVSQVPRHPASPKAIKHRTAAEGDRYQYLGDPNVPCGRYDRDDLTPSPSYRTWGQFRGYPKVRTFVGVGGSARPSASETIYMRGMAGDCQTVTAAGDVPRRSALQRSDHRGQPWHPHCG